MAVPLQTPSSAGGYWLPPGVAAQETSDFAGHEIVHYGIVLVAKNGGVDLLNRELATDGRDQLTALTLRLYRITEI
jgi:hypothetical protein